MGINQKGPVGPVEGRVLQQGGFNTPLGNQVARNVGRGGPGTGRTVYGSGSECSWSGPLRPTPRPSPPASQPRSVHPRSPDVMNGGRGGR